MASSSIPPLMKDEEPRNWADLPSELTSSILLRLGTIEILENAQKVCTSWRRVSKDPSMWRKIDMYQSVKSMKYDLEIMCRHAVDRSQCGLVEIDISYFGTDNLLKYIADSASNLRSLKLASCSRITDKGVAEAAVKLPLLEDLDVSYSCNFLGESLRVVGQSCPNLKTLKLNCSPGIEFSDEEPDNVAVAIAESMPELRHLHFFGVGLTNTGLNSILDGCPHLELLDLRKCFGINLVGDLEKRCSERIRVLRRPNKLTSAEDLYSISFFLDCLSVSDDIFDDICCLVEDEGDDEANYDFPYYW